MSRVALWGTFDVDNYGDHLFPMVARHELRRRLPGVVVDAFAPFGSRARPTAFDVAVSGCAVEPLSQFVAAAGKYDFVLVGGGEIVHRNDRLLASVYGVSPEVLDEIAPSRFFVDGASGGCPVAWNAVGVPFDLDSFGVRPSSYVSVRDPLSSARLRAAGVTGEIALVPDTVLVLERVLDARSLDDRLAALRRARCFPSGGALVVQGCDLLVPFAARLAATLLPWLDAHPLVPVVLLETGRCRGDGSFADAFAASLRRHVYRMPRSAGVEDVAAAVRASSAFVGSSLHGAVTAFVYGRPFVVLNAHGESKLDGFGVVAGVSRFVAGDVGAVPSALDAALAELPALSAARLPSLQRTIDAHFDRIAALVAASAARRGNARLNRALRRLRLAG